MLPETNFSLLQFRKTFLFIFIAIWTHTAAGQRNADTTQILDSKENRNYSENNKLWKGRQFTVRQELMFNDKTVIDEEYVQFLTIEFIIEPDLNIKSHFDLAADSSMIKCFYQRIAVWHWEDRKTKISGHLKIIWKTKRNIKLEFNLIVTELNKAVYVYKGVREFKKSKLPESFNY